MNWDWYYKIRQTRFFDWLVGVGLFYVLVTVYEWTCEITP